MKSLTGKAGTYTFAEADFVSAGSFGRVYKCKSSHNQILAIKIMEKRKLDDQGPYLRVALSREIQVQLELSKSSIPFFVKLFDSFEDDKNFYMVMEYCECTLTSYMRQKPRTVMDCLDITYQVGMGLAFMHRLGMTHRDIKPDNILVLKGIMKIADFGFACQKADMMTSLGTPVFMSPEFYTSEVVQQYTNKVDVWALNHSLYKLLTGRHFFEQPNLKEKILNTNFTVLPDYRKIIDPLTEDLLRTGFIKNPAQRPSMIEYLSHRVFTPFQEKYMNYFREAEGEVTWKPNFSIDLDNPVNAQTLPIVFKNDNTNAPKVLPGIGIKQPNDHASKRAAYNFLETLKNNCQLYFEVAKIIIANDINRLIALQFIKRGIQRLGVVIIGFKKKEVPDASFIRGLKLSQEEWVNITRTQEFLNLINQYIDSLNKYYGFYRSEYKICDDILKSQGMSNIPYDLNENVSDIICNFARQFEKVMRANPSEFDFLDGLWSMLDNIVLLEK